MFFSLEAFFQDICIFGGFGVLIVWAMINEKEEQEERECTEEKSRNAKNGESV